MATDRARGHSLRRSLLPSTLTSTATLGSIGIASGLTNGTVLHLVVSDCNGCFGDNSGSFAVGPAVPEPGYFGIVACALLVGLRIRARTHP
jgi:hypothetical protein